MVIIVSSSITERSIESSLGASEYSYYFLLKLMMPVLESIGQVIEATSLSEVKALAKEYSNAKTDVIFLSFANPQTTPTDLPCPTYCIFAWDYLTLPSQSFANSDWKTILNTFSGVIVFNKFTASIVQELMGDNYPVISLDIPFAQKYQNLCPKNGWTPAQANRQLSFSCGMIDSPKLGLSADGLAQHLPRPTTALSKAVKSKVKPSASAQTRILIKKWWLEICRNSKKLWLYKILVKAADLLSDVLQSLKNTMHRMANLLRRLAHIARRLAFFLFNPKQLQQRIKSFSKNPDETEEKSATKNPNVSIPTSNVVFCSVVNPKNELKNWQNIISAFCWAFKNNPNATLILKISQHDIEFYRLPLILLLSRLSPIQCRVIAINGYLDDEEYRDLIRTTDFYVNASSGEKFGLPVMEFLAAGKPAIAPFNSAMQDYLSEEFAYNVASSEAPTIFPQDPLGIFQTRQQRIHWQSLVEGYLQCYATAQQPEEYQRKSYAAWQAMHNLSDITAIATKLKTLLITSNKTSAHTNIGGKS